MPIWYWFMMTIAWGCCVGSFLNVVVYRLPEGQSLIHPPSRCPKCEKGIKWFDNIPVLSWFILGGKCRNCETKISFQYPLVEAITGGLMGLLFVSYYIWLNRAGIYEVSPLIRFGQTWPLFLVHAILVAGLLAATIIDARLFIIPLSIPVFCAIVAIIALPLGAQFLPGMFSRMGVIDMLIGQAVIDRGWYPQLVGSGYGGIVGVGVANLLLWTRLIPRSFDESTIPEDVLKALEEKEGPESWYQWENPRAEVLKELLYLIFPIAGMFVGAAFIAPLFKTGSVLENQPYLPSAITLGAVLFGFLVGGGIVWLVRILGTLGFGKEAMGLGDVHLLCAVGAAMGWFDVIIVFFIAPFFGIAWTVVTAGVSAMTKREVKMIPYGPHLAVAALVMMLFHQPIRDLICTYLLIC